MLFGFRILGSVELRRDGEPVVTGPPKRLAMLTALLLQANEPVRRQQLVEAMWPGEPPSSAVTNIRTHAAGLRRAVGGRLVTRRHGYLLRVADRELDAAEFARLARAGKEALAAGDPANAVADLAAARALWRGPAGEGVPPGTWLQVQLTGLEEQWLDVFEDYAAARLHTSAYADAVADLRQHLWQWPLRERAWQLLMLALYRSGNVPGALDAYGRARATLRDHLGVDPGRELQLLHRAMLNREDPWEAGAAPRPVAVAGSQVPVPAPRARDVTSPPHQLPQDPGELVGRAEAVAQATDVVRAAAAAAIGGGVVVSGRTGAGKSALILRTAHQVAEEFPDGQVYLDLGGAGPEPSPRSPAGVVAGVLRAMGVAAGEMPHTVDERAALYRSLAAGRRMLLVLDAVASSAQLWPLLTGAAGITILAASRRRLATLDGLRRMTLSPLADGDAADLLAARLGAQRVTQDPASTRTLARSCDGLPLAVRIVADRLVSRPDLPLATVARHLARHPLEGMRLGDLSMREHLAGGVRAVAAEHELAGRVFPLLGMHSPHDTLDLASAAAHLGEDPERVFHALENLVDAHLAVAPRPRHYRAPGLLRHLAVELGGHTVPVRLVAPLQAR